MAFLLDGLASQHTANQRDLWRRYRTKGIIVNDGYVKGFALEEAELERCSSQ